MTYAQRYQAIPMCPGSRENYMKLTLDDSTTTRMNVVSIIGSFLLPCFVFTLTTSVLSFWIRYLNPTLAWGIVGLEAVLVLWLAHLARVAWYRHKIQASNREPSWYLFLAATVALAWVTGMLHGQTIYNQYMKPYYDLTSLNSYEALDINKVPGSLVLDAGYIVFDDKAYLDRERFASFTDGDTYCVAPVVAGERLVSYDFWVVGMNCCGDNEQTRASANFNCGESSKPNARAGVRLMDDSKRAYYNLAVQQAAAQFHIQATAPQFFEWVEDPLADLNAESSDGHMYHLFGIFGFVGLQLFLVVLCVFFFWQYSIS